ncbi:hypothetical protein X907_1843 [Glycocaulis alkaliphilus]|uniref:Uncharacterized protein n=1 Tax=Glycocaulis alkaliphilus TaxID=1434191 RepID=A0A3T0EAR3_9PROT|nr:hypothetical protein X907_1843 [Glycocaulis alkaliphilus]
MPAATGADRLPENAPCQGIGGQIIAIFRPRCGDFDARPSGPGRCVAAAGCAAYTSYHV